MFKFVIVCALVATAFAAPAQEQQTSLIEDAFNLYSSCSAEADIAVCLKLKALGYVDRVARSAEIEVVDGFKIVQNEDAKSRADNARSLNDIEATLPTELAARESAVDEALLDRASRFLSTHTVELSIPEEVSSLGEARGKKKKKKIIESLKSALSLLKLKAFVLIPLAVVALKFLVFKAIVVSKIALILSLVLAARKFFDKKPEGADIVPHELPHHHDDHHASGWGRSLEMAYSAYKPTTA